VVLLHVMLVVVLVVVVVVVDYGRDSFCITSYVRGASRNTDSSPGGNGGEGGW
jgi:hypothetical protein